MNRPESSLPSSPPAAEHNEPVEPIIPQGRSDLEKIQQEVNNLRALRDVMAKRRGFRSLTDKEIRNAINKGRR